jgi:hypothetical protein
MNGGNPGRRTQSVSVAEVMGWFRGCTKTARQRNQPALPSAANLQSLVRLINELRQYRDRSRDIRDREQPATGKGDLELLRKVTKQVAGLTRSLPGLLQLYITHDPNSAARPALQALLTAAHAAGEQLGDPPGRGAPAGRPHRRAEMITLQKKR